MLKDTEIFRYFKHYFFPTNICLNLTYAFKSYVSSFNIMRGCACSDIKHEKSDDRLEKAEVLSQKKCDATSISCAFKNSKIIY